jgi:hypothetical protein
VGLFGMSFGVEGLFGGMWGSVLAASSMVEGAWACGKGCISE